jgi:hypothetical protein
MALGDRWRGSAMTPSHPYDGKKFDPDEIEVLMEAYHKVLQAFGKRRDDPKGDIAKVILEVAGEGETDTDRIRDLALTKLRLRPTK